MAFYNISQLLASSGGLKVSAAKWATAEVKMKDINKLFADFAAGDSVILGSFPNKTFFARGFVNVKEVSPDYVYDNEGVPTAATLKVFLSKEANTVDYAIAEDVTVDSVGFFSSLSAPFDYGTTYFRYVEEPTSLQVKFDYEVPESVNSGIIEIGVEFLSENYKYDNMSVDMFIAKYSWGA